MCGIAGILDPALSRPTTQPLLEKMIMKLDHRGPDEKGYFINPPIALAHARLSIIDLSTGQQPMGNEDGTLQVIYNGEIYNYIELRSDLLSRGHRFRTASDTEVILHAFEEWGNSCINRFNGQFAFAIWDSKSQSLFLARDRLGVRPLFYTQTAGRFLFASEVKALFADSSLSHQLDLEALDQIFTFWHPLPGRSGFKNIFELPPGHSMTVTSQKVTISRYWKLEYPTQNEWRAPDGDEKALTTRLIDLLADAVRIRLRADVQVGAYLSGGLDSSLTTSLIKREIQEHLETFSIGFESPHFDESKFQVDMVRHLGTEHHPFLCDNRKIGQNVPLAVYHMERPVIRLAPIPMMLLSKGVREAGIKVVLTGEGADEIFGGYDIYKEAKVRRFWAQRPDSPLRPLLLRRLYPYMPGIQGQSMEILKSFFLPGLEETEDPFYSHRPRWRVTQPIKSFYSDDLKAALKNYDPIEELRGQLPEDFSRWHSFCQVQYLESAYLLPQYILSSQGDRMGMANSVEGRFPFLDHRVVEFAAKLPPRLKMRVLREKHILKECGRELLPPEILHRKKQPYRAPDHAVLFPEKKPLDTVNEVLSSAHIEGAGIFNTQLVTGLKKKAMRVSELGTKDGMTLVAIITTQMLHQQFIESKGI